MLKKLKFSVAMSAYKNDNPVYLDRALESVITLQTIVPNEIVFVVDGPVGEDLNSIINKYEQEYEFFRVIRLEKNGGLGNALRIAVAEAKYELIARMDSDDVAVPDRFEQQLNYFTSNEEIDIVGGDISEFIDKEDNIVAYREVPKTDEEIKEYIKTRCPLNHVSVMFKKSAVIKSGGYLDLFWNEDYYLWIRMAENKCVMANTGTVLVNVRVGEDMYRRRGGMKYFKSEKFLQKYMLKRKMISRTTYTLNVLKRFIVQCLLPNKLRGFIFKKFARKNKQDCWFNKIKIIIR